MQGTEVLVVGAGPTGLAVACGLRAHGVDVRVVDKASGPVTTSRANFVHARGSEVLDRLGALGTLPEESVSAMAITTYLGDEPVMKLRFGDPGLGTAAPPMVISQAKVEAQLRRRLAELGVAPAWGAGLVDVAADPDGVTATLDNGDTIRAQWLVGCDGTASTTRKLAGISAPGVKLSERFLLADVRIDWDLDRSGTTGWIHPDGMLGVMPMPDPDGRTDLWRVIAYDPGDGHRLDQDETLRRLQEIVPTRTGRRDVRIGEVVWLSNFTIHRRLADQYRSGRILLAGDAAHAHAPFGGQGMLTGLGDAENLAFKLALVVRGLAGEPLLDTYQAERRPLATEVLRSTSTMTRINVAENPIGRFLRDRVLVKVLNLGWVQRWATYTASQLWVSYRNGPLGGGRYGRQPRPGDRIADLGCVQVDGGDTRLYRELGSRWGLLLPEAGRLPEGGVDQLVATVERSLKDFVTPLRRTDGAVEAWLVRPDGHLAWRGTDPAGLDRWLSAALREGRTR